MGKARAPVAAWGAALLMPVLLAACANLPPPQVPLTLPRSADPGGLADPTRGAVITSAYVFGNPASLRGDPAGVAEALGRLEFITVELDVGPRWIGIDPTTILMLQAGRAEARAAFGIDPAAPPQQVVDSLFAVAVALRAGDREAALAALAPIVPPGQAEAVLARMAELPVLPRAAAATRRAQAAMLDMGQRRFGF
ncbi:hypothetical protein [Roseomonas sp. AR75]|uniref:hypothetical protein n=1 Tax=Roseomonas sp. AR75 TaxID=2562311 RepID=UPI0010C1070A|nr:hypothetical protein [Roseomonas sp. AR75]